MGLVVNQELDFVSEPTEVSQFISQGLLNSNYQSVVKQNFSNANSKSIFGIRQHLKSTQLYMVNHTAVILKLSVILIALVALFY